MQLVCITVWPKSHKCENQKSLAGLPLTGSDNYQWYPLKTSIGNSQALKAPTSTLYVCGWYHFRQHVYWFVTFYVQNVRHAKGFSIRDLRIIVQQFLTGFIFECLSIFNMNLTRNSSTSDKNKGLKSMKYHVINPLASLGIFQDSGTPLFVLLR